ncbi:hypothetical protein L1049_002054 [Liquidambar formosana]|uniref:Uncharacterized protein n=1 Tax=Liquidambar formosana TaxID=63359 RepID=A0AAP0NGC7_LIQFO
MDILPNPSKGSLNRYWRRRKYHRLDGAITGQNKNVRLARFGGGRTKKFWKIRAVPKLRLKAFSPLKLWTRFKNAYMDMMLNLAGSVGHLNGGNVLEGKRIPKKRQVPLVYSSDEFENRLVYEIYKAMIASRELGAIGLTLQLWPKAKRYGFQLLGAIVLTL